MFVNSAVSQYPSLAFQFAFDQAGENFHTAAQCVVEEDSGQATPLLSKGFVESIGKIPMVKSEKTFRNQAENSMFVWVAMTVVLVVWVYRGDPAPPAPPTLL